MTKPQTIEETLASAVSAALQQGLSLSAIARRCDVPKSVVSRWWAGESQLSLASAEKIAKHFRLRLR